MKTMLRLLAIMLVVFPLVAIAGDDPGKVVSAFQSKYASLTDMTIAFTQVVQEGLNGPAGNKISGTLTLMKGNKYRIELDGQTIVSDGKTVWTYSQSTNQVLVDNYQSDSPVLTPDRIFSILPTQFTSTVTGTEKLAAFQTTILNMVPNDKSSIIKQMKVWVDDSLSVARKVQVQDVNDNIITYTVDNLKINSGVTDDVFKMTTPKGAESIDMR